MTRIVKKAEVRRQELVESARQLFLTKGYDETSMQNVMEHLSIAKGTIYHYFKSKEELLEAVVELIVDENAEQKRKLLNETLGTALEKFQVLVAAGRMAEHNYEILDQLHKASNVGMHIRLFAATLAKEAELYAELIRQGCDEGVFQTDSPLECAEFILTAVQFLTDIGVYPWTEEQLLRRAQAFPSLIEAQLKAPSGSFNFLFE